MDSQNASPYAYCPISMGDAISATYGMIVNYVNRFFHADPDGTQIRLRDKPFNENERKCVGVYQSEGRYTDEEAFTICAQQYTTGGVVCISERFPELQESRFALLRHITPAFTPPAEIIDFDHPRCPTLFLTEIVPRCSSLGKWWTLAICNWEDDTVTREITLADIPSINADIDKFAVFEFYTQKVIGIVDKTQSIEMAIPAHGTRILRIMPWDGSKPKILGTDLHISGGGCEIVSCSVIDSKITGTISTEWKYPVVITSGFPSGSSAIRVSNWRIESGETEFVME